MGKLQDSGPEMQKKPLGFSTKGTDMGVGHPAAAGNSHHSPFPRESWAQRVLKTPLCRALGSLGAAALGTSPEGCVRVLLGCGGSALPPQEDPSLPPGLKEKRVFLFEGSLKVGGGVERGRGSSLGPSVSSRNLEVLSLLLLGERRRRLRGL